MQDLSTSSKKLERLHESFSERAGDIPCIVSFREAHKYRGQLVSFRSSQSSPTRGSWKASEDKVLPCPIALQLLSTSIVTRVALTSCEL